MSSHQLQKYAFWWSEARLIVAAVALLLGGIPPIFLLLPGMYGLTAPLLKICWIISGAVSLYLAYEWHKHGMHIFGGKNNKDSIAFAILIITGINLGLTGLIGTNIGMSIIGGRVVFFLAGLAYLWVAYHIYTRYYAHGQRFF